MPVLETRRLILRPLTMDDQDAMVQLWNDPDVFQGFGRRKLRTRDEVYQDVIAKMCHWEEHGFGTFAVLTRDGNEFTGYCELEVFHSPPGGKDGKSLPLAVELAYALAARFWGQGYASEAVRAVVRYGFETAKVLQIFGATGETNLASQRVMESAGLKFQSNCQYYPNCLHYFLRKEDFTPIDPDYICHD